MKFKIDDKVRVIDAKSGVSEGTKEVIANITEDAICTKDGHYFFESELELVEDINSVPHPICPLNLYFEGDENKCDTGKCDFDTERRGCTESCIPVYQVGRTIPPDNLHINTKYGHPEFYKLLDQMAELHSRKNHDYAGKSDPLKNLRSSKRIGIDPFVAVIIRLQDKWSRLEEFLNAKTLLVKNESVEDTLMDNAVYSLLAIILLREQKENNVVFEP